MRVLKFYLNNKDSELKIFSYFRPIKKKVKKRKNKDYLLYKKEALKLVEERINHFNLFYNYKWNKIFIKNQKTRWGSCSKKGNLNFNYKIVRLSRELADYIIVHELCHLGEFNHSKNFWVLIEKTIPNYKTLKDTLKHNPFNLSQNNVK